MRRLTFAVVMATHVLAVFLIDQTLRVRKRSARPEPTPLTILFLSRPQPKEETPRVENQQTRVARPVVPPARGETQPSESPSSSSVPIESRAITDWAEEAHSVANDLAERERARAALRSFQHEFAERPKPEPPGVFGSEKQNHRAGLVELGEGNSERHWVTDNCYFEFDRSAPRAPNLPGARVNPLKCKPPPTGGGEHMFDQLKPGYLKNPPEPAKRSNDAIDPP